MLSKINFNNTAYKPLSLEQEVMLAKTHDCGEAGRLLVQSQMKLAYDMSKKFFARGAEKDDFFQEAMIGVSKAVKDFEPDRGYRLSTYAYWKIRSQLLEVVRKNLSLVVVDGKDFRMQANFQKVSRRVEQRCSDFDQFEKDAEMAKLLRVSIDDVQDVRLRLERDDSLNSPAKRDGDRGEMVDFLKGDEDQAASYEEDEFGQTLKNVFRSTVDEVCKNEREKDIFIRRRLVEEPISRPNLAIEYGISQQRVAQLESQVFERLKKRLCSERKDLHQVLVNT